VRSASRDKIAWISELQGGSSRGGITVDPPVPAGAQQRWIHHGMSRGAKGAISWCWRDEVFCSEASGFGIVGWDGCAEQRIAAMRKTGAFIDSHRRLIDAYEPDAARVGVLFAHGNYYLNFARRGQSDDALHSVVGCAVALERLGVAYEFVEGNHVERMAGLDVLLMPWCLVLPEPARRAVLRLLRRGGHILLEAETDAYDERGFYRYPDERPFMEALGLHDLGRRELGEDKAIAAELGEDVAEVPLVNFATPLTAPARAEVLAANASGEPLLVRRPVGRGAAYVLGGFAAQAYHAERSAGFEALLRHVCRDAGVAPPLELDCGQPGDSRLYWRTGRAGKKRLLWLINADDEADRTVTVTDRAGLLAGKRLVTELLGGRKLRVSRSQPRQLTVTVPAGGSAVLCW
jgi:beta-galactosidase